MNYPTKSTNQLGKSNKNLRKLVYAALLAALVFVGSAIRITLPVAIAGTTSFHLGNIACALSGIFLGPVWGAGAAGIGSMLYDWTNPLYFSESWITLLTKGLYGLAAGWIAWSAGHKGDSYSRNLAATAGGAITYAIVYLFKSYLYNGRLVDHLTAGAAAVTVVGKLPATIFNAVIAIACAPLLAQAIQAALKKSGLQQVV